MAPPTNVSISANESMDEVETLLSKEVQSLVERRPRADADAEGSAKVIVSPLAVIRKSVPLVDVAKSIEEPVWSCPRGPRDVIPPPPPAEKHLPIMA